MSRRIALNHAIAGVLSPVLIPQLISIVQSYTSLPDVLLLMGGVSNIFEEPSDDVHRITLRDADDPNAPALKARVVCEYESNFRLVSPLERMCCAVVGDRVYVCGGLDIKYAVRPGLAVFDPFDVERGWQSCSPFGPYVGSALVAAGSVLYVFGGRANLQETLALNTVSKFDTATSVAAAAGAATVDSTGAQDWKLLPARMNRPMLECDACVRNCDGGGGTIFVTGTTPVTEVKWTTPDFDYVSVFDVKTETFVDGRLPRTTSAPVAVAYYRSSLWAFDENGEVYRFREPLRCGDGDGASSGPHQRKWDLDSRLQTPRSMCRVAVMDAGNAMLVIGGKSIGALSSIELYDDARRVWVLQSSVFGKGSYGFAVAHCH